MTVPVAMTAILDGVGQAELVRTGELTPADLVGAAVERISRVDPELNAVIIPLFEQALAAARSPDLPDGPFRGVPLLLKDAYCHTAGDPYHFGMGALKAIGHVAATDAHLAARFRAAGFVICGRTNTPELAGAGTTEPAAYGPTRNPWDVTRTPGGSSGGSAAAVAAGMVPIAHGNDSLGSIRIPASACGLVGLKPAANRVSLGPGYPAADHQGVSEFVLTRSVRDCAAVLDAIAGPAPGDLVRPAPPPSRPFSAEVGADPGRLTIGIRDTLPEGGGPVAEACAAAVQATARLLELMGHDVHSGSPPALDEPLMEPIYRSRWVAMARHLDHWGERLGRELTAADVEPSTWDKAQRGRAVSGAGYLAVMEHLDGYAVRLRAWWADGNDLLLTPTMRRPPVPLGDPDGSATGGAGIAFTAPFNISGQPAISLPVHWSEDGLPIGVQLVAAPDREDLLLRVAAALEEAVGWQRRRPPIHATMGAPAQPPSEE